MYCLCWIEKYHVLIKWDKNKIQFNIHVAAYGPTSVSRLGQAHRWQGRLVQIHGSPCLLKLKDSLLATTHFLSLSTFRSRAPHMIYLLLQKTRIYFMIIYKNDFRFKEFLFFFGDWK